MKYYGVADAHGIESFFPAIQRIINKLGYESGVSDFALIIRANANRHRHAVVYQAELEYSDAEEIKKILDKKDYKKALLQLKKKAKTIELAKGVAGAEKSWNLIPNDDLDPFS